MNFRRINRIWQSATLLLAPVFVVVLIWFKPTLSPFQWLLWLHLPLLMFHEAEEYVLSPLNFKEYINLKSPLASESDPDFPLDEGYVFQVNIVIAWPLIILGAILAPIAPWVGVSMIWFELLINNVTHTMLFQGEKLSYTPGLVTNSFLLVPYSTWTLLCAADFFSWQNWLLSALLGAGVAAALAIKTKRRLARFHRGQGASQPLA